jgi:Domain of unknown function (DUF1977)
MRTKFNHQRFAQERTNTQPNNPAAQFLQLLPLLLMLLFSFLSMFGGEDSQFSFHQTYDYSLLKTTPTHSVHYYVNPGQYARKYTQQSKKKALERSVEAEYLRNIQHMCSQEREQQRYKIAQASSWFGGSKKALENARGMKLGRCEEVAQWYRKS